MTLLYSLLNAEPAPLPEKILVDGVTRTDPNSFTPEEIEKAGYEGPFTKPSYDPETQVVQWYGDRYAVLNLAPQEVEARRLAKIRAAADYRGFWKALIASSVYQTLRAAAAADLGANMLVTELIAALGDAKAGDPNEAVIGAAMQELLSAVSLPVEELDALYFALKAYGLDELFPIPGYTPPEPPAEPPAAVEPAPIVDEPSADAVLPGDDTIVINPIVDGASADFATSGGMVTGSSLYGGDGVDTLSF